MKTINQHIKNEDYSKVYLIYGDETYLKKQARDKLINAISKGDTMNYSYYEGEKTSVKDILDMAQTMPFFAEKRLIVIENSGFLKSSNEELADYIKAIPDYLVMVFVESEADKRNKVYKAIAANGYVAQMNQQSEGVLSKWIYELAVKEEKAIDRQAISLLLDKTGGSMEIIRGELDKVFAYCADKNEISVKDIEAICVTQTTSRIFEMIEAVSNRRQQRALELYYDLLTLKEPPMRILYLIVRQFNGMLQVKEAAAGGSSNSEIAARIGVAPFVAGKYAAAAKNFSGSMIKQVLQDCADVEESVKTGKLNDRLAVEMIIVKYSAKA